jgi:hypothetical protein
MKGFPALNLFFCALFFAGAAESFAQPTNLLKEIQPGVFQLGSLRLDKEKRLVQFPATINMTNGLVEYFLVAGTGKLHESILKTETEPAQIHVAMLLLGAHETKTNASSTNLIGDKIWIEVRWKNGGTETRLRAEELIFDRETKSAMNKGPWIYNGSKVIDGTFIAQRDGSIVSIIGDPFALVNNLQPHRDNDEIWFVNTNKIPPWNTPVEVTFQLEQRQKNVKGAK